MAEDKFPALHEGMSVVSADNQRVGEVREVFRGMGLIESFGEKGIPPQQEGHDPVNYDYSTAMPGAGDSYFTVTQQQGPTLYIPFAALSEADAERAVLAIDAVSIPDMSWDVRPDALAASTDEYPDDTGGDPKTA